MNIYDMLDKVFTMMYDGQDLTDYFLVQEVRGRSVYSKEMGKRTIAGVDGGVITTESFPARELEVDAIVFGDGTETDLRRRIEYLNFLLHREKDVPITFSDEPSRTYYGRYEFASEGEEKGGFHKVTLSFYCQDPFKRGPEEMQEVSEADANVNLLVNGDFSDGVRHWSATGGVVLNENMIVDVYDLEGVKKALHITDVNTYFINILDDPAILNAKQGHASCWVNIKSGETTANGAYLYLRVQGADGNQKYFSSRALKVTNGWTKVVLSYDLTDVPTPLEEVRLVWFTQSWKSIDMLATGFSLTVGGDLATFRPYGVSTVKNTGLAPVNPKIKCIFNTTATEYEIQQLNNDYSVQRFLKVKYGFNSGDTLVIDCHERTVTLNGQDIMPALLIQSEWFQLKPQINTYFKATQPSTIVFTEKFL